MALTTQYTALWNDKFLKLRSVTGTGAGVINETLSLQTMGQLVEIRIQSDGAATTSENFTVKLDSGAGATFDQVLYSVDLSVSGTPVQYTFSEREGFFGEKDAIDIDYPNTETNTVTFELIYRMPY